MSDNSNNQQPSGVNPPEVFSERDNSADKAVNGYGAVAQKAADRKEALEHSGYNDKKEMASSAKASAFKGGKVAAAGMLLMLTPLAPVGLAVLSAGIGYAAFKGIQSQSYKSQAAGIKEGVDREAKAIVEEARGAGNEEAKGPSKQEAKGPSKQEGKEADPNGYDLIAQRGKDRNEALDNAGYNDKKEKASASQAKAGKSAAVAGAGLLLMFTPLAPVGVGLLLVGGISAAIEVAKTIKYTSKAENIRNDIDKEAKAIVAEQGVPGQEQGVPSQEQGVPGQEQGVPSQGPDSPSGLGDNKVPPNGAGMMEPEGRRPEETQKETTEPNKQPNAGNTKSESLGDNFRPSTPQEAAEKEKARKNADNNLEKNAKDVTPKREKSGDPSEGLAKISPELSNELKMKTAGMKQELDNKHTITTYAKVPSAKGPGNEGKSL